MTRDTAHYLDMGAKLELKEAEKALLSLIQDHPESRPAEIDYAIHAVCQRIGDLRDEIQGIVLIRREKGA